MEYDPETGRGTSVYSKRTMDVYCNSCARTPKESGSTLIEIRVRSVITSLCKSCARDLRDQLKEALSS